MVHKRFKLIFSDHRVSSFPWQGRPSIIFSPSDTPSGKFSRTARFVFQAFTGESLQDLLIEGEVYLTFFEHVFQGIARQLSSSKRNWLPAGEFPWFFTMQLEMNSYREIVRACQPEQAEAILLAMNDVVAIRRSGRLPKWFENETSSDEFRQLILRNSETFFAYHNAGSILGGLEEETLRGISTNLRLEFKLGTFENSHVIDFSFDYDDVIPKRIAVVIGKNGVGKSQALAHFANALLTGKGRLTDENEQLPIVSKLLAFYCTVETRNTFPRQPKRSRMPYRRFYLSQRNGANQEVGVGGALVKLVISRKTIREKGRWDLFLDTVAQIAPISEIAIPLLRDRSLTDEYRLPMDGCLTLTEIQEYRLQGRLERLIDVDLRADVFRLISGELIPMSSGQRTFIRFAAHACLHIENGTIVLFDEPETHLHPNYISEFVTLLNYLLAETGSFAILATHSAYFVREVTRSQVVILRQADDRKVDVASPRLRTLGADIGEISHFVFEDPLFGKLVRDVRQRLKDEPSSASEYLGKLENELSAEAWMSLNREITRKEEE